MPIQVSLSDEEECEVGLRIEGSPTDATKPDISQVRNNKSQEEEKQAGNKDQFEVPHELSGTAQNNFTNSAFDSLLYCWTLLSS